jgi:hypothetical protein
VNYDDTLERAFSYTASVGSGGCGFEQTLEAMKLALEDVSTGFLRADARLAVITLQDEDDCSFAHSTLLGADVDTLGPLQSFRCTRFGVTCDVGGKTPDEMNTIGEKSDCHANEMSTYVAPVTRYRATLESAKPDPRDVLFVAIAADPTPVSVEPRTPPGGGAMIPLLVHSCGYEGANGTVAADPAVRMNDLAHQLRRGRLESMCSNNLQPQLHSIGRQLRALLGDTCLPEPLVGDCKVYAEPAVGTARELARCGTGDCYELVDDVTCGGGARLHATLAPSSDVMLSVRCTAP